MKKIMSPSEKTTQTQQTPHNTATAWSHMKPADEATIPALLLVYLLRISALGLQTHTMEVPRCILVANTSSTDKGGPLKAHVNVKCHTLHIYDSRHKEYDGIMEFIFNG